MKTKSVLPLSEYRKLSDEEVVHRYVHRHEPQAMSALFERYAHPVLGMCFQLLGNAPKAQDATQLIFTHLIEDLKSTEITHFKSWLIQYCSNQCRKRYGLSANVETVSAKAFSEIDESKLPEKDLLLIKLETALSLLPDQQEKNLRMFYLQKNSFRNIARSAGMSVTEVKKQIRSGRNRILTALNLNPDTNPVR